MNRRLTILNNNQTANNLSYPTNHITPLPTGEGPGERLLRDKEKKGDQANLNDLVSFALYRWFIGFPLLRGDLLHLLNDGLESLRVVDSEVSEHLAVNLDTCLVQSAHES